MDGSIVSILSLLVSIISLVCFIIVEREALGKWLQGTRGAPRQEQPRSENPPPPPQTGVRDSFNPLGLMLMGSFFQGCYYLFNVSFFFFGYPLFIAVVVGIKLAQNGNLSIRKLLLRTLIALIVNFLGVMFIPQLLEMTGMQGFNFPGFIIFAGLVARIFWYKVEDARPG